MKKVFLTLVFLPALLLFTSCNNKPADTTESKPAFDLTAATKAIDEQNTVFMNAASKCDTLSMMNCYAADGKFMQPNMPAVEGRKNIGDLMGYYVRNGMTGITLKSVNFWGSNDGVTEEQTYAILGKDGKEMDHGKGIVVWKMEDGNWKIFRDCFNSDMPPMASK